MNLSRNQIRHGRSAATIGNMGHVQSGSSVEQRARKMRRGPYTSRAVLQLRRAGLRVGEEGLQVIRRKILLRDERHGLLGE